MESKEKQVLVPESMVRMLFEDITNLHEMLAKLISMYEQESELKKHHRPYLHIREEADEMCQVYSCSMSAMQKRWFSEVLQNMGKNILTNDNAANLKEK